MAEYASNWGTPAAQYTHGPNQDEPLARITQTGAQYFHHDGLGSVVALTNNVGGTDATQRFDAWGNQIAATGTQSRYGYTGREPDESGLVFYRARFYDPSIGRFTQRDPIGLQGGINQYVYVGGNPVNFTDPTGLIAYGSSAGFGGFGDSKGSPSMSNASSYPAPDTSMIVACAPLCTGLGALPPPPVGGYQGLPQEKPTNDGYQQLFGGQRGAPPSLGQQIGNVINGLVEDIGSIANAIGGLIFNEAKPPKNVEPITNPPQAPVIPDGWVSKPGRVPGSEIFYPPGSDPSTGEHIRVMPPGSSAVPGSENGYWVWVNGNKQPMDPSTGKPGKGRGDTHIPLPPKPK